MNPLNLRHERLNRGLSLRQAAALIGVSEQSIRRVENGHGVTPATALKIATFFGVQVIDILPKAA